MGQAPPIESDGHEISDARGAACNGCVRVVIVSDIRLYRDGLALVLAAGAIDVVGMAASALEALELARSARPDAILLDLAMPRSIALVPLLRRSAAEAGIVALTVPEVERDVVQCAEGGVSAYVTREETVDDLVTAIQGSVRGEAYCSPRVTAMLLHSMRSSAAARNGANGLEILTPRELAIVELLELGLSNKEIGERLQIEIATVKNHVHNILAKLRVRRRAEAAPRLRELGWRSAVD
jgi:two-component system, NarL family, nitrate/nitrite response regulator NarL